MTLTAAIRELSRIDRELLWLAKQYSAIANRSCIFRGWHGRKRRNG